MPDCNFHEAEPSFPNGTRDAERSELDNMFKIDWLEKVNAARRREVIRLLRGNKDLTSRLAQYEATGLKPEDVMRLKIFAELRDKRLQYTIKDSLRNERKANDENGDSKASD